MRWTSVVDGDSLGMLGCLDDGVDGPGDAVLGVDAELGRDVRRRVPQLDVRVDRPALAAERELHALRRLLADVPRLEGAALHLDRRRAFPDVARERTRRTLRRNRLRDRFKAAGKGVRRRQAPKRWQAGTSSMTRPTERCDVVSRAAPCSENEAAEPTSASPTMDLWSIVALSVAFERAALVMSSRSRRSSDV